MDFTLNIKIEATPEFCRALDNIANTITAAFPQPAASNVDAGTLRQAVAENPTPIQAEAHAPSYVQNTPPAPAPVATPPAAVPVAETPPAPAPVPTVPTTAQAYTQDQLALAASGLMDAGKLADLQKLLASFNVASLVQLPKEQYGAFATKLREMGAKI